ncbi:MAG: hypothetical protein AAB354_07020 [candidate division KSB1 bacterium]
MTLDLVFVCQQGELEVMSAMLAASLRRVCGNEVNLHAVEPSPREVYGTVSPAARKFLDGLGVKWYSFSNPISDDYKIFNKLNAFNIEPRGDRILFLDSDILIRRSLAPLESYFKRPFAAKSGNKQRFSRRAEDWQPAYGLFDLPVPEIRWPGSDSHEWAPPYFNAGVILVDPALNFSELWIDTCRRIHFAESVQMANRGTVQVGLPVALYRSNIPYALLDQRFNFGLSKGWLQTRRAWAEEEAHVVHYFNPKNLTVDPVIHREVWQLVKDFQLEEILALSEGGQKVLKSFKREPMEMKPRSSLFTVPAQYEQEAAPRASSPSALGPQRMAFITGIPGSGASRLAALLAELPDIAVMHEPKLNAELLHSENLEALGLALQHWRNDFSKTQPPADFVLATKHTLGYLSHLERMVEAFPQAKFFVMVRHPFDAIPHWLKQPAYGEARFIEEDELAGIAAPSLCSAQRESLAELQPLSDVAMKRAGLWDYFADLARRHAPAVHIFRYEDLRENTSAVLRHAYGCLFPERELDLPQTNFQRDEHAATGALTVWDKECIRAICSNNAGAFGYQLYDE